jgi:hypothetical protein
MSSSFRDFFLVPEPREGLLESFEKIENFLAFFSRFGLYCPVTGYHLLSNFATE